MKPKWFNTLIRKRLFIVLLLIIEFLFIFSILVNGSLVSAIIAEAMTVVSITVSLYIISKKDKGAYKLTWVFTILIFPLFGGLLYIIFHFQTTLKRYSKRISAVEKKGKDYFFLTDTAYQKAINASPQYKAQIDYISKYTGYPVYDGTDTKYLSCGEEYFKCLLTELKKAEKYIFLEYFIIEEGKFFNTILDVLKQKAKEGVKVRIIYDDMGCFFILPKNYRKFLESCGIECVVFNPFRPVLTTVQNNRDHRKIASIDGMVAFTGGINLADEYINEIEKHGHWKDGGIMLKGKGAWSLTMIFLEMWEICTGSNENYKDYLPERFPESSDGFVQPYADSPLDNENISEHIYLHIINSATEYLYITTPYLIIDDSMISALSLAAKSGVDVRIITPHKWDKWLVHKTTRSYYANLIRAGIKIYEYENGFIHSKTLVSDDKIASVGTANLDFRSLYLHFECGVKLYGSKAVFELKNDFLNTVEASKEITLEECKGNVFTNWLRSILRIFAPLM